MELKTFLGANIYCKPNSSLFLLCLILCCASCISDKQQRLGTAFKVMQLLNQGKANDLHNLFVANPDDIGKDIEQIQHDCRTFQYIVKKYGFPDSSQKKYEENPNDIVRRYTITLPILKGQDTMWNWTVREISLTIEFGAEQFNRPSKIADYNLEFDRDVDLKDINLQIPKSK